MDKLFPISLDRTSSIPIYRQLGDIIYTWIQHGTLLSNYKLPPIRSLSKHLNINTATVVAAYRYLEQKKAVYTRTGSGTFVSPIPLDNIPEPLIEDNLADIETRSRDISAGKINFADTSLPDSLFPVEDFRLVIDHLLEIEKGNAFRYTESQGYFPLRESLSRLLENYHITAPPQNILIVSGAQQGIDIISKAMLQYGDIIFMETPTFYGAAASFLSRGGQIIEIPLENDGMDLDLLENLLKLYHPKFIYTMAYFQTPTGISYSMAKKRRLIDLANQYGTYIIEDDNLYDFNYTNESPVPFKALDYQNRVIYIKSFSKILMPGLRIGCMVLPQKILRHVTAAKYTTDRSTSGFLQQSFDLYLKQNNWSSHIQSMCQYGKNRYHTCIRAAKRYLPDGTFYRLPEGGNSLWIKINNLINVETLCHNLDTKGVILSPGNLYTLSHQENHHIRLCFTSLNSDQIEVGMKRFGETLRILENK